MPLPSSCLITGVFSLSDGARNPIQKFYVTYFSALEFPSDEQFINVSIRKYTATTDLIHEDNTFAFVVAKAALLARQDTMLDAIQCIPFIPPPDGFDQCYPLKPTHTAVVTGTVTGVNTVGSTQSFTVGTSEYVRDERHTFSVRFEYDSTSNRWKNVPLPTVGSPIVATGTFQDILEGGHGEPVLSLLDISYGSTEVVTASPTRTIGHRKHQSALPEARASPPSPTLQSCSRANKVNTMEAPSTEKTTGKRKQQGNDVEDAPPKQRTRKGGRKPAN